MLVEIQSEVFRVPKIIFHNGLNVVIGDPNAANSIGKSTFLMVIDFAFGGDSFIDDNGDVPKHLGHHFYSFSFVFENARFYFKRGTENPRIVYECNANYEELRPLAISDYTEWLSRMYTPQLGLSFRAMLGPYSRVWPKDNIKHVNKPLHAVAAQSTNDCINTFMKLFDRFSEIEEAVSNFKRIDDRRKAWKKAEGLALFDKIGRREYSDNEKALNQISEEVADMRTELAKYALNIREVADRELLDLAQDKDLLLKELASLEDRLRRIENNLSTNKHIKSEQMSALAEFFPDVNLDRIARIEEFHSSVARLLKKELQDSKAKILLQIQSIKLSILDINAKITDRLKDFENPTALVDRVYNLSAKWNQLKKANTQYEKKISLDSDYDRAKTSLGEVKNVILEELSSRVNAKINEVSESVYGPGANSPILKMSENSYSFDIGDDTGTGTAYANLVLFDIAVLYLTQLPILIHDLPLFKNVENEAVAGFIVEYTQFTRKQIFTVLDEIGKYGQSIVEVLRARCVLELNDEDVLYKKKWSSR